MDKNSIIGFVLIAAILFGFTFIQSRKSKQYAEQQAQELALQAQRDSIAFAEAVARGEIDTTAISAPAEAAQAVPVQAAAPAIYKDSLLEASHSMESSIVAIENDKVKVEFDTRGAQPYTAMVKDYYNYDSTSLYLFKPGASEYAISIYAGEYINTTDFVFQVAEQTPNSVTMRLPFSGGGYIEQKYTLREGEYMVDNELSFVGMGGVIPRNVSMYDIDYTVTIPRMEKGYENESQYSKLDYYFDGEKKPVEIGRGRNASKRIDSKLNWFAFQQQFFSVIVDAPNTFASGELAVNFATEADPDRNLMTCSAKMRAEFDNRGGDVTIPTHFYFGPNHFNTLKSYDRKFEKIIPLGGWLVGWFTRYFIIPMFNWLHRFISNFGLIILIMTLVIKLVVFPLTYKSYASSAKMQALKPWIEKINERYPKQEDALKKQQATMDLYKRADVSAMGGCLPTLLTFPILWAMFRFFPASIELRQQGFLWADDLSAYDSIIDFGTRIPLLGDHLSLFALLMAVTMWIYSKMTTSGQPTGNDPNAQSMKFMTQWMMPIMMFFICNNLSSGLSYYYLLSQLISMLQVWLIRKYAVNPEQVLAKVKASEGKPLPKSKFQQRLEEAQRMQQQQMRQQQNKSGKK